jgi:hypothetical protein
MPAMQPHVRRLALYSLSAFALVVLFGAIRSAPTPLKAVVAASPEAERAMASFHAHFDALCWAGSAALAFALHAVGPAFRGPAWAPRAAASGYMAGSAAFAAGYAVKAAGLVAGRPLLARGLATAVISGGGLLLIGAAAAAAFVVWSARAGWSDPG